MAGVLDQVRESCAWVADRARFVQIDSARLPEYAASLPLDRIMRPEHDASSHYLGHGDDTVAFFLTLDAINFGSGYFPHLHKRPGMSGYFTIAASLNDYFAAHGPLAPGVLARLTAQECAELFGQDMATEPIHELMGLFAGALNDLGNDVLGRFGSSYTNLLAAADGSAEQLVAILRAMQAFDDVATYEGRTIQFFKRAQLAASDLWIAFGGQGPGAFADLDRLTIFADNLVPHVLRIDGVLRYDAELAARIDAEMLIPAGAHEEVELRACAVHAAELIVGELRCAGHPVNAMQLDNLLWSRGQRAEYKQAKPRHRTRSLFY